MKDNASRLRSEEFDFPLPRERVALHPKPFEEQKLLIYDRARKSMEHRLFKDLAAILHAGDLLVVNDSKVVPAALWRGDGKEILFMEPTLPGLENIKAICPPKTRVGIKWDLPGARFIVKEHVAGSVFRGDLHPDDPIASLQDFLQKYGTVPIPPYLKRRPEERDATDYQTVFAKYAGSIACPTAGLHFNEDLIARLNQGGVDLATITLHVGYGTFKGFKTEFVDEHVPDAEPYHVTLHSLQAIGRANQEGRRVIAVGTTVTRVLESIPAKLENFDQVTADLNGEASLFIYPPFQFKVIDGLITNFATPKNPVMSLAAAFIGLEQIKDIYRAGLEKEYMFYTYGDALLAI
jgi:S-adenosylmethionine:tRNA ribosyltransferase-isomerase